jgi:hypothetical protein
MNHEFAPNGAAIPAPVETTTERGFYVYEPPPVVDGQAPAPKPAGTTLRQAWYEGYRAGGRDASEDKWFEGETIPNPYPEEPTSNVETTTTPRGFHVYGGPVVNGRGEMVQVYESSNAMGPHVWLELDRRDGNGVNIELNEENARATIARLQAWLDEIPARWGEDR